MVRNICRRYNVETDSEDIITLHELLGKRMGYFPQFSKWLFEDEVSIEELVNLADMLKNIKIDRNINSFNSSEELYDYLTETKNKRILNRIIKSLPSKVRRNISNSFYSIDIFFYQEHMIKNLNLK